MRPYQQLDAFRVCHELTLRIGRLVKELDERDPELAAQLWSAALVASSRIARGCGMGARRMFAACLDRTLGALSEIGYHLDMARALGRVNEDTNRELEGLRGRAVFYTTKLIVGLRCDPGGDAPEVES